MGGFDCNNSYSHLDYTIMYYKTVMVMWADKMTVKKRVIIQGYNMPNKTGGISMGELKLQLYTGFICGNSKYIFIYNRVY